MADHIISTDYFVTNTLNPGHSIIKTFDFTQSPPIIPTNFSHKNKNKLDFSHNSPAFIATGFIGNSTIFNNGLYQNAVILADLLKLLGYIPVLIFEKDPDETTFNIVHNITVMTPDIILEIWKNSQRNEPIKPGGLYIEVGMSISGDFRTFIKERFHLSKIVKLYLGNIVNIDIETPTMVPSVFFNHHVSDNIDQIWTSPHYLSNLQYACYINKIHDPSSCGKIMPYIWSKRFTDSLTKWTPKLSPEYKNIVICEPNISAQKSFLYPLLLAEAYSKYNPLWKGNVFVLNFNLQYNTNAYVKHNLIQNLSLFSQGRIKFEFDRLNIKQITDTFNTDGSVYISHQYNNDYNYMTLELMISTNAPVLHDSYDWKSYGYYWNRDDLIHSITLLDNVMKYHDDNLDVYKTHAEQLAWKHSIHNPHVLQAFSSLIQS